MSLILLLVTKFKFKFWVKAPLILFIGVIPQISVAKVNGNKCTSSIAGPYEAYNEFFLARNNKRTNYHTHLLKKIDIDKIKRLEKLKKSAGYNGIYNNGIFSGRYRGKSIFIKLVEIVYKGRGGLSEASYTKFISDLELGPIFIGVIVKDEKIIGFATELIQGGQGVWHQHRWNMNLLDKKSFKNSEYIQDFLYSIGFLPGDLQYRLKNGKLWVVDTGGYFHSGSRRLEYPTPKTFYKILNKVYQKTKADNEAAE